MPSCMQALADPDYGLSIFPTNANIAAAANTTTSDFTIFSPFFNIKKGV